MKIYVDGVLGDAAALATSWDAGGTLQLGRAKAESGYTNFWLGSIDEVRIYDRALSADEIPALAGRRGHRGAVPAAWTRAAAAP